MKKTPPKFHPEFEPNPNWTREYPGQEEILDYLISVAHKYQLYKHIRFSTSVEEVRWDAPSNTWKTKITRLGAKDAEFGEHYTITSNFLVSGVGQLNVPKYPDIQGVDSFKGKSMHSARWDWDYDLRGKRIGIIGNGATAAQIIPEVAKMFKGAAVQHMETQLPGEKYKDMREKLMPKYDMGCKRVIITDDYFPTFTRENVVLETSAIKRITEKGVEVEGEKEHEFDLLIYATGFKTTQFMYPIKIYGTNGKSLDEIWASGASAYLGMTIPSLPNFSMLYGPNTNLGHNSIILMIEAQAMYINALITKIKTARDSGHTLNISPKQSVVDAYNADVQRRLAQSAMRRG
ncbi:putative Uncharacterized monooxygenase y4iD [Glarea lozoyensis 74030]|uniref:Putative Uncharacterized monooxygenase y4iD n=1 Tax=Glarea lozoyensis (strain ATCC 74030 / MF5533) TaxID=1104152 RepID=H0EIY7_GLAL7|nr:putative Uncharacterized monooxygenase y4iD [Glarea lozoyensis 74030]